MPSGFTAVGQTWTSADDGWVLGTAPCATQPCAAVLHTTDSGVTWHGGPAPRTAVPAPGNSSICGTAPCWGGLWFANQQVGYAYSSFGVAAPLWITKDSGKRWQAGPAATVFGLEVADGSVVRVISTQPDCSPGCTFEVQSAPSAAPTSRP